MSVPNTDVEFTDKTMEQVVSMAKNVMRDVYGKDSIEILPGSGGSKRIIGPDDDIIVIKREDKSVILDAFGASHEVMRELEKFVPHDDYDDNPSDRNERSHKKERDGNYGRDSSGSPGQGGVRTFGDGSIRFTPEFTKEEADYGSRNIENQTPENRTCKDCAHYIEGGGCHLVQGDIEPDGYCHEFYADVGVYGRKITRGITELNLTIWGEKYSWDKDAVSSFLADIKDKLNGGDR